MTEQDLTPEHIEMINKLFKMTNITRSQISIDFGMSNDVQKRSWDVLNFLVEHDFITVTEYGDLYPYTEKGHRVKNAGGWAAYLESESMRKVKEQEKAEFDKIFDETSLENIQKQSAFADHQIKTKWLPHISDGLHLLLTAIAVVISLIALLRPPLEVKELEKKVQTMQDSVSAYIHPKTASPIRK